LPVNADLHNNSNFQEFLMETLFTDLRYAIRMLRKHSGFTITVVIILAFGIGMNTIIFSLVNAILFHPFPYKKSEQLVFLIESNPRIGFSGTVSAANFQDWKRLSSDFEGMELFTAENSILTGGSEPERLRGLCASSGMSMLLGVAPVLGRGFLAEENTPGGSPVVLLSHAVWQRRFQGSPDILGRRLILNSQPHTVVGILPANYKLGYLLGFEPDYWKPLSLVDVIEKRADRRYLALARLKPEISRERAQSGLTFIARQLEKQYPQDNKNWGILVADLRGNIDPVAYLLILVVICAILGIVCVNLTNLMLARTSVREREIAIKSALGANRRRLARQLLTESLLLALLAGVLGIILSFWTLDLIRLLSADTNLVLMDGHINLKVLGVTFFITIMAGIMIGISPALQFTRLDLNRSLKESGKGLSTNEAGNRFKRFLVIAEVSLSMILLVGGGLALKSLYGLLKLDRGFQSDRILVAGLPISGQQTLLDNRRVSFFQQVLGRLENPSWIESAALTSAIPTVAPFDSYRVLGHALPPLQEAPKARLSIVSRRFFETLEMKLKTGRPFSDRDMSNSHPVAIINETLAHQQFEDLNPLGMQVDVGGKVRSIVGVVEDTRNAPLNLVTAPEIYVHDLQFPRGDMHLLVRTNSRTPLDLGAAVKKEIQAIDANQLVDNIQTMEKTLSANMGVIKMGSSLLSALALGALILTGIGIYGVLSFLVAQRSREFGIRMALGAHQRDVLKLVLKQGLTMVLIGAVPGVLVSIALGMLLASRIHGLHAVEPGILVGVFFLLSMVAFLACIIPANRATKGDPLVALREE
jgi:putative ABC transport system permease protein